MAPIPGISTHQKWLSYQILGGKNVKNVQIDPQNNGKSKHDVSDSVTSIYL